MILDCNFGPIANPVQLADQLARRDGLMEHGLFVGLAQVVVVNGASGIRESISS
jgi:ribose 5-phosphate isomerase A